MAGCAAITGASPDVMLKQWRAGWTALPGCRSTVQGAPARRRSRPARQASPTYPVLARLLADSPGSGHMTSRMGPYSAALRYLG